MGRRGLSRDNSERTIRPDVPLCARSCGWCDSRPESLASHDSGMTTQTPSRLSVILDGLYRWRWWTSALLCAVLVFVVGNDSRSLTGWVLFGFFALLLWVPIVVRWVIGIRSSGRSFREGLDGR